MTPLELVISHNFKDKYLIASILKQFHTDLFNPHYYVWDDQDEEGLTEGFKKRIERSDLLIVLVNGEENRHTDQEIHHAISHGVPAIGILWGDARSSHPSRSEYVSIDEGDPAGIIKIIQDRINLSFEAKSKVDGENAMHVRISIGIATVLIGGLLLSNIRRKADMAMACQVVDDVKRSCYQKQAPDDLE